MDGAYGIAETTGASRHGLLRTDRWRESDRAPGQYPSMGSMPVMCASEERQQRQNGDGYGQAGGGRLHRACKSQHPSHNLAPSTLKFTRGTQGFKDIPEGPKRR